MNSEPGRSPRQSEAMKTKIWNCAFCGAEMKSTQYRSDAKCCTKKCNMRKWESNNVDRRREINRKSSRVNSEKIMERVRKWNAANPDKRKATALRYSNKQTASVSVSYAAGILAHQTRLKVAEIPAELAELKRLHILVKREIKNQTKPTK